MDSDLVRSTEVKIFPSAIWIILLHEVRMTQLGLTLLSECSLMELAVVPESANSSMGTLFSAKEMVKDLVGLKGGGR